ncbi:MAG TPA: hypothetical protein VHX52_14480 [Steroidobacteraceae bacterium]|jgi:hypothetical protein|nr:hypothetical protein [Steroidobacteraceae bacterium]
MKKVVPATGPAQPPFEASAFDGTRFHLTLSWAAPYGPSGKRRDFGRIEGLLDYVCDIVNALAQSVTLPQLQQWGDQLTELLRAAVEGSLDNPSDEFLADISERFEKGVLWNRRLERIRGGVAFRYDAHIADSDGFYALLAMLLMDPRYRQLIRHCPQCGKFFMRVGKRLFCSEKCATAANDAGVLDRQKDQRWRRAAVDLLLPQFASREKCSAAVKQVSKNYRRDVTTAEQLAEYAKALLRGARKHK